MKRIRFFCIGILFITGISYAQDKALIRKIDSLNNVSYEKKIETSGINLQKFLTNLNEAEKINYKPGMADSQANISLIYFYQGKYDKSTEYFLKAIEQYKALNQMGKAGSLYGLYGYRLRHTDLPKAIEYMQTGIKMAEKANARFELMGIYDNYGLVKEANEEFDSAAYFYNKSLKMKQEAKDEVGIPYSLNKLGTLNAILGNYTAAKKYLDEAYQMRLKLNDKTGIAENLSFYGSYYELLNDREKAIEYFERALKASKEAGYNWLTYKIYESLSANYEEKNNYQKALNYLKQYNIYKDSIYNLESTSKRNELEVQFETAEKERKILKQRAEIAENKLDLERKNQLIIGIIALAVVGCLIVFQFLGTVKLENKQLQKENELKDALIRIETQNKIQEERLRISRDLHDNIGSQLTFIISSLDNLKFQLNKENPEAGKRLEDINQFTRTTITELRDTIWAMNKESIRFSDLQVSINNFIENAKIATPEIRFQVAMSDEINEPHEFTAFEGINIYRVIQESIHNSVKHSNATEIKIRFDKEAGHFIIQVSDNGKGFDETNLGLGNGINNMHKRIAEIGGELSLNSQPGSGTILKITI